MKIKTDGLLKMTLVFCIAVLSFAVGTFVGKQYSDQQHKLAAMEPTKGENHEHEAAAPTAEGGEAPKAMTDEEMAKLSAEFIADDQKPAEGEHGPASVGEGEEHKEVAAGGEHAAPAPAGEHGGGHEAPAAKPEAKAAHPAEAAPHHEAKVEEKAGKAVAVSEAQAMVEGKIPAEKAEIHQRAPSSVPKNLTPYAVGNFTVQLAAYNNETEAKQKAEDLKGRGFSAFYVPADIKGKTWFRVSVGLFSNEKEAKDFRQELINKGEAKSALVQKIAK